ncbi:Multidrug efflux pump subunit AcrA (membrane-fusion protein) [Eubacterium ruminantium]|nr:Multidrug efflux pump subunit AcrA (membrane-fusion protein) [Eubacterium ruminantium]
MNKLKRNNKRIAILLGLSLIMLSGCGKDERALAEPNRNPYARSEHVLETVQRGDLESSFSLTLRGSDFVRIDYKINPEMIYTMLDKGELTFDGCFVSQGQTVKEGDLLLSYTSKKLDDEAKGYEESIAANNATIDHYRNLMYIDSSQDYSGEIERLNDQNEVMRLYLEDVEKKRNQFRIYAEKDGTITFVYKEINEYGGYIWQGGDSFIIMSEATGSSIFSVVTDEDYPFKLGDVFEAKTAMNIYQLKLTNIEDDDKGKKLTFEPVEEGVQIPADTVLTLNINRQTMKDVVYVNSKAIKKADDDKTFLVYVVDDDGFKHAVVVETGKIVSNKTVIEKGLSGGETLSLD